jgi:voltage-gated potassium channel
VPRTTARFQEFDRLRRHLAWALGMMLILILVGVVGYSLLGGPGHDLVDAVYMTVITLTTVGFSEVIDLGASPGGRIFTIVLLLVGMGIFAYAVPMLAAFVIEGHVLHIFARRRMQKSIDAMNGHHVVCGDSGASWFVTEELRKTGRPVVMVLPDAETLAEAQNRLGDVPYVLGDPTEDDVLRAAAVGRAAGVVAAMHGDKDNILVVFTARRLAPQARIVAAVENPGQEPKLKQAGANAVVSPYRIGGLRIASELVRPTVVSFLDTMLRDRTEGLRVEEVTIPKDSHCVGSTVSELQVHELAGAVLLAIRRPGESAFVFDPAPSFELEAGMVLVVMVDAEGRSRLERHVRAT